MGKKRCLLAVILTSFSLAYAWGGTGSVGTVSVRGNVRLDGSTVWGNGTLFDGTAVETNAAGATLRLDNGTEIKLAVNSRGVVYRDHLVLLRGRSQLKTAGSPFAFEAGGLRLAPSRPNSLGIVSLSPTNTVDVAAVTGEFLIVDNFSSSVAHVSAGAAMSFDPPQEPAASQGSSATNQVGLVSFENGNYYLTARDGVKYELITGKHLQSFVNKKVIVSGFLEPPSTPSGATQIEVTSIKLNTQPSMSTETKALIGTAIAGGAAGIGIGVYEATKPAASR